MTQHRRVLHVVESFASGTLSALTQYVRSTPSVEHHLLKRSRPGEYIADGELSLFASVGDLPSGYWGASRAIRRSVAQVKPSLVHAHSSLAGGFVRTSIRTRPSCRIVYTPHCFAFERRDIGRLKRAAFLGAEWCLAYNTDVIAACSEHEAETARRWRSRRRVVHVPSFSESPGSLPEQDLRSDRPVRVVTTGRIGAQKDPAFFADVISAMRELGMEVEATWVGAGSKEDERMLAAHGIHVSGWLSRTEAIQAMVNADVYIHSAAWEGFPISVLEAHALHLPILVRDIPAFVHLAANLRAADPLVLAGRAVNAFRNHGMEVNRRQWDEYLSTNSPSAQSARLREVYR